MGNLLRIGEVLRYTQEKDPSVPVIDDCRNFHHVTAAPDLPRVLLEAGINTIAKVPGPDGRRRPALLIRSSPWKAGTEETPWHDEFDLDNGQVRYFEDHKAGLAVPVGGTRGNAALLEALSEHCGTSVEERVKAAPLLLFRAVTRNKRPKGHVEFCGIAVIERAEQVTQESTTAHDTFTNYRYDLAVLDLSEDDDQLDWAWINARRDRTTLATATMEYAPNAWRRWVAGGQAALPTIRRRPRPRTEDLTADQLVDRLRHLTVHRNNGRPSRHKPLTLLWAISGATSGRSRMVPWREFRDEVGRLLAEFGHTDSSVTPEYPFWHLRSSGVWEVEGASAANGSRPNRSTLDELNPTAGLTPRAADLLQDPFARSRAVAALRETYLADIDHHALMERLGLEGYESASGTPEGEPRADGEETRAVSRRTSTRSPLVRDSELAARVKQLHENRCQVCGLRLDTRYGTYSEAAHIRGLGRPHDGPDALSNLLVMCPNHHVQFDTLAIYIDTAGTVRRTANDAPIGTLRRHPAHEIEEAHLRYHRGLCGR